MMQELAAAICLRIDQRGGRPPSYVRVSPVVMRALEADLGKMKLKHDPKLIGGFKVCGIEIVEDPAVFFAESSAR